MLRRLNMPLAQVAEVVSAPDPIAAAELLTAYWEAFERRVAGQRELMSHIRSRLSEEGRLVLPDVKERTVAEQLVLTSGVTWPSSNCRPGSVRRWRG